MVEKPEDQITHIHRDDSFGYQSFHYIFLFPPQCLSIIGDSRDSFPRTFEMQVRTLFMHAYAEPQHNFGYENFYDLPKEIRKSLAWVAASAWGADREYQTLYEWEKSNRK